MPFLIGIGSIMGFQKRRKPFLASIIFVLVLALWIIFAPHQLGGRVAYVILTGNSMEPGYFQGDLVVVRQIKYYQIGDVVAYQHPNIGPVFHRIVDREGEVFLLKGDNNTWIDSYKPTPEEVIGKIWLRLPKAGDIVKLVRTPTLFVIMVLGVVGFAIMNTTQPDKSSRIHKIFKRKGNKRKGFQYTERTQETIFTISIIGLISLVLAVISFSRPINLSVQDDLILLHEGNFGYSAEVRYNIYDQNTVLPGDPIFRQITEIFNVDFTYSLLSENGTDIKGTYSLVGEVRDVSGWKHTLTIQSETEFEGSGFSTAGEVDIKDVQSVINNFELRTGLKRSSYIFAVRPIISIQAEAGTLKSQDTFSPALEFILDDFLLHVNSSEIEEHLNPTQTWTIPRSKTEPNTLGLFSIDLPIFTARLISIIGLVLSLSLGGWLGWQYSQTSKGGPVSQIELLYSSLLVKVLKVPPKKSMVEVDSIEDLVKLAERHNAMIMSATRQNTHTYYLKITDTTYYFQVSEPAAKED